MRKMMLVFVALLFSANFALATDVCDGVYDGTCLENVTFGPRTTMTASIPSYPFCTILIYYRMKTCVDALGNYHVGFKIEWWEINKGNPADCAAMYNALWDEDTQDWDQVLYEQVLGQIDQAASDNLINMVANNLPPLFFKCSENQHLITVTTTKVACYSPVAFISFNSGTNTDCNMFIVAQVPCGNYGCCYEKTSSCRDAGGNLVTTVTDSGYIPGGQSGCGTTPPMSEMQAMCDEINLTHPNCEYEILTFLIRDCHHNCSY